MKKLADKTSVSGARRRTAQALQPKIQSQAAVSRRRPWRRCSSDLEKASRDLQHFAGRRAGADQGAQRRAARRLPGQGAADHRGASRRRRGSSLVFGAAGLRARSLYIAPGAGPVGRSGQAPRREVSRRDRQVVRDTGRSCDRPDAFPDEHSSRPRAPLVPLSVDSRGRRHRARARPADRRGQERHGQRGVLPGTLSRARR